jgi:hypothetical protein
MSPNVNIPLPQLPKAPKGPPAFGSDQAAGMQQRKSASANAAFQPSVLGSQAAPSASNLGGKTLLGQ